MLKIGHIELFVRDPMKSKDFYEKVLGCEVVDVQGSRFVWLKLGDVEILLRPGVAPERPRDYQHAKVGLVIYTDRLEPMVRELTRRGLTFDGYDGSERSPTFTDPDGNWFQLTAPDEK